jgi:hypothetical protein
LEKKKNKRFCENQQGDDMFDRSRNSFCFQYNNHASANQSKGKGRGPVFLRYNVAKKNLKVNHDRAHDGETDNLFSNTRMYSAKTLI